MKSFNVAEELQVNLAFRKVTAQMKPLPEMDIIPPFSAENKEADVDRDKRKMLTNNVNMMQMEVANAKC